MATLEWFLSFLCLVAVVLIVVALIRDRTPDNTVTGLLAALEIGLVVQLVIGIVRVAGDHAGVNVIVYLAYLIGSLLVLPAAWIWSAAERSRGGTGVLLVGVLVIPVLFLRLADIWSTHV